MPKQGEFVEINGCGQYLSSLSSGRDLPILLYLHGGPGDAALPLVAKYNNSLERSFNVVVWEQRGAGKSYYPFSDKEEITISIFVEDIYSIAKYLLSKYEKEKLYLVGHSWGSVLGLEFCRLHPEMVYAYIGCGQVVNMKRSSKLAYEYAVQKSLDEGNTRVLKRLERIDCSYSSEKWLRDLLFVTKQVVKHKGSLYGRKNYAPFVRDIVFAKEYSLADLMKRQKGAMQSLKRLWPELMTVNFEKVTEIPVPVVFVEGRYDYHVSSKLAKEYFDRIVSPKRFFWFENSCHFPHWSEAEKFTEIMCDILKPRSE